MGAKCDFITQVLLTGLLRPEWMMGEQRVEVTGWGKTGESNQEGEWFWIIIFLLRVLGKVLLFCSIEYTSLCFNVLINAYVFKSVDN